ncbi:DUF423 domain-containing protein [Cryomorpha ignava]|uniref:DUF423 domain-containing protein n=1 Tax=Cryomorpha ignava TaxID=101383 RepID=A0A7K3WUJ9_9FLAO|nr:DUF423 domain-containing protein [Cryomorpha ignava]NEN25218.1 DUF423 domain-containing protein [Cryomorpha ignava]
MKKTYFTIAAFSMAIAVLFGAMGAHSLKDVLTPEQLDSFKTGVRYQVWHSLAIFILMLLPVDLISEKTQSRVALFFVGGIILFSFSIYLLATLRIFEIESFAPFIGPITPLGGVLLIGGWLMLGMAIVKSKVSFTH